MRRRLQPEDIDGFLREYGRKAPRHGEPNDRRYDHRVERLVKRMDPRDLDDLMRGDVDERIPIDAEDRV